MKKTFKKLFGGSIQKGTLMCSVLIICLLVATGCRQFDELFGGGTINPIPITPPDPEEPNINEPCNCIMDTIKGDWTWFKSYKGHGGYTNEIEFQTIIKILNQNEDASINYQVFVADTLFYEGTFQLQVDNRNRRFANIKLPHWIPSIFDEKWIIYFGDILTEISNENTICFWDGAIDGYFYYYQKIREE